MRLVSKFAVWCAAVSMAGGVFALGPHFKAPAAASAEVAAVGDWPLLGRNADMQHNSPLKQIDDKSVSRLGLAWHADIPSLDGLVGNPLVVDGVVYQSGPMGRVYATDVRTGKLLWRYAAPPSYEGLSLAGFWSLRWNRGLAVRDDKVFVATGDCRLIAIDRKSGTKVWETGSCDRTEQYGITGAPRVGGGMVFIGNNCIDSGAVRGFVDAFDEKTGERKWRFYTVPDDPTKGPQKTTELEMAAKTWGTNWYGKSHGCGSVWDAMTFDEKLNRLYIGTAGPAPWSPKDRAADAGDELFTNSIVALDASTGQYIWHFKTTPNDGWNFDASMGIMIADLQIKGQARRVVMSAPKNGFFYLLDAKSGEFLGANNYTPVNWAKGVDQKTGRPIPKADARYWLKPDGKAVASPGPLGAHNWQPMAFSDKTGLVYIPVTVAPSLMEANPDAKVGGMMFDMYYGDKEPKWKPYGELVAYDPVAQTVRWRAKHVLPINGGTLTTAGNLVFQGTADGKFEAYAADTGKLLWSYAAGGAIQGAPSTVEVDGEQMVLVPVGNGTSSPVGNYVARYTSTPQTRTQARLLAFKLDAKSELPKADGPPAIAKPPRARYEAKLAKKGEALFEANFCVDCHGLRAETGGGTVLDLRRANAETHDMFVGIVIGGLRKDKGMPPFQDISIEDANLMQAYIINEAWNAYDAQKGKKKP